MRLNGKTALITGGSSGIGLATARLFVAEGARVAIAGRNQPSLDAAARELGPNALAFRADLREVSSIDRAVAEVVAVFGKLDIVFANAGIGRPTPVGDTSFDTFQDIITTNLTSVFFTVQAAAPHLREGASIILNGSVHAALGVPGYSAYAATKGAVRSMTRVLAAEFAPRAFGSIKSRLEEPKRQSGTRWHRTLRRWLSSRKESARLSRSAAWGGLRKLRLPLSSSLPPTRRTSLVLKSSSMAEQRVLPMGRLFTARKAGHTWILGKPISFSEPPRPQRRWLLRKITT
jgi:NAD(P)-dependent dehydrogenase (short-subunit alcohol dehydrogenase family)